ncbi:MAG TPA: WYL domain-containing protein [Streptosporangiaceae bacterium]|nr:WYL domain-containing protein [Streptosporangiaceae bacterium]
MSPRGRRLAALQGGPPGIRVRRRTPAVAGREGWVEAWVRIDSMDATTLDMLALGADVEVIHPPELRMQVGRTARQIADLHSADADGERP